MFQKLDIQAQGRKRLVLRHQQAEQQVFDLVRLLLPWTEVGKATFRVYQISCELRKSKMLSILLFFQSEIFRQIKCYIPIKSSKFPLPSLFLSTFVFFSHFPLFSARHSVTLPVCRCLSTTDPVLLSAATNQPTRNAIHTIIYSLLYDALETLCKKYKQGKPKEIFGSAGSSCGENQSFATECIQLLEADD